MKRIVKFIIFFFTPHLLFDRLQYLFAKVDAEFFKSIHGQKNVFIFLACDYANLGDYAITLAQKKILQRMFPDSNVVTIPINDTYSALKAVVKNKQTDDVVTLIGGGNMGDMYYGYERKRNLIISKLHEYKIISFPQTISFSKSLLGRLCLKRTMRTYSAHPYLTLLAREKQSFERMKDYFPKNNVFLTPDVVMTYDVQHNECERSGIILTLRNDNECSLSEEERKKIIEVSKEIDNVSLIDTCPQNYNDLNIELTELLKKYSESKLVVTDRLHGMVFAYITRTPTLVFENNNGKIKGCYEWIKDCGFIQMLKKQDLSRLDVIINDAEKMPLCGTIGNLAKYFEELEKIS